MAATSHDFWLHNLTAPVWKRLHMLVYVAYGLLIAHVTLGALQSETSPVLAGVLGARADASSRRCISAAGRARDDPRDTRSADGFVPVCDLDASRRSAPAWSRAAASASPSSNTTDASPRVSNVCQHQNGPLGEGKIIDGCITCPWHGYQYLPESGASPPPFTEKVPTLSHENRRQPGVCRSHASARDTVIP